MTSKSNNFKGLRALAVLLSASLLAWGGVSFAQKAPPRSPPSEGSKMSPKEKLKDANAKMAEMKGVLQSGFEKLREARQSQDVQMLNRVNEALSAIKGLVRLAEASHVALQEAVAKNDAKTTEHEYVKISIAHTKVMELQGRLRSSLGAGGEGASIDGKPVITPVKDSDLPTGTPEETLIDALDLPDIITDRPPATSPVFF